MVDVKVNESHTKTMTAHLRTKDIEKLILEKITNEFTTSNPAVECKFNWEDETEGSPAYKIGVQCHVTIIKNLNYVAEASPKAEKN